MSEFVTKGSKVPPEAVKAFHDEAMRTTREILGMPRWTDREHENARRCCPTCGTPACNHPDRVRGEDALPIPPAALKIGADQLGKLLKHQDRATVEMIADSVFRSMLEACSK